MRMDWPILFSPQDAPRKKRNLHRPNSLSVCSVHEQFKQRIRPWLTIFPLENPVTQDISRDRASSEPIRRKKDQPDFEKALANLVLHREAQDLDTEQLIKLSKRLKIICRETGSPEDGQNSTSGILDK